MNLSEILRERLAIVGGTGSGKSYTARGLVEKVLHAHGRVGIIDPTGVWHGLRVNADGKSAGFPVVIFGGDRSDVPLIETAGRVVAQAVATSHQSWIIDTSALKTKAAERRFMLDFLDALFETNRDEITLVVDEADRFSPQRMSPEVARLHERMEEIVRRGRVRGFTPWLITQRPASLNKDVLSQATAMICMRMTGAHDRGAMADVIEGQADKATAKAIVDAMPRHKVGSGLVWAPQQDILLPVHFPQIVTLDTMRPTKPGERRAGALPPLDLGALREKLATVETEARANDPAALKKRIRELEAEVAKKPTAADPATIEDARQAGWHEGHAAGISDANKRDAGNMREIARRLGQASDFVLELAAEHDRGLAVGAELRSRPEPKLLPPAVQRAVVRDSATAAERSALRPDGASDLSKGERAVLTVLAQFHPTPIAPRRAAAIAGYSVRASTWRGILGKLRARDAINGSDPLSITPAGLTALGDFEPLPTGRALLDHWLTRLPKGQAETLRVLATIGGHGQASDVASRAGYSTAASTWRGILAGLRVLCLVEGSRTLKLHEDLR